MYTIKGTPREGLTGATLGFFVGFAAVALFGPTAKALKDAMDLSPLLVGLLVAMPSLSGSLLRIPFSAWVDTTGGRKPFLVLLTMSIVGMAGVLAIILMFHPGNMHRGLYPLLLICGLLCGCGIATFSVGISQVSYWHPQQQQGRALGIYAGVGNLAPGIFSFVLPLALAGWGLAGSYLAWLMFLIIGTALYMRLGRNSWFFQLRQQGASVEDAKEQARAAGQVLFPAGTTLDSLALSAKVWKTWVLVSIYFTTFGGFIALTAWFPTYWQALFGASAVAAGSLTATYSILASLARVAGGGIADKLGGERTLQLSLAATFLGATVMVFSGTLVVSILGVIVLALGMGVANAAVFKLVPQEVPQAVGGAAGWVGGLGAFGGFAIPPVLAFFVESFGEVGYARGFTVFMLLAAVSLAATALLRLPVSSATATHSVSRQA